MTTEWSSDMVMTLWCLIGWPTGLLVVYNVRLNYYNKYPDRDIQEVYGTSNNGTSNNTTTKYK